MLVFLKASLENGNSSTTSICAEILVTAEEIEEDIPEEAENEEGIIDSEDESVGSEQVADYGEDLEFESFDNID